MKRAEEVLSELAELNPENALARSQLARSRREMGDLKQAAVLIGDCISRFPEHPDRQWWLTFYGDILLEMGSVERAREIYSKSIAEFPDDPSSYGGLARALQQLGDAAGVVVILEDGIDHFPQSADRNWWLTLYGHALCDIGKLDRAELVFRRVTRLCPYEAEGPSGLARVASQRGDWPVAIRHLTDCTMRFPQHPDMRWWVPLLRSCEAAENKSVDG